MRKTTQEVIEAGEPLMQEALNALKAYHEALAHGRAADEVGRLRVEAERLFQATSDYQLRAIGEVLHTFH